MLVKGILVFSRFSLTPDLTRNTIERETTSIACSLRRKVSLAVLSYVCSGEGVAAHHDPAQHGVRRHANGTGDKEGQGQQLRRVRHRQRPDALHGKRASEPSELPLPPAHVLLYLHVANHGTILVGVDSLVDSLVITLSPLYRF